MLRWLLAAVLILVGTGAVYSQHEHQRALDSLGESGEGERIVMISAEWCGYCTRQIKDFKAAGVRFRVLDYDQPEGRRVHAALGGRGVPVTAIDGQVVHGYNRPLLKRRLSELGYELN
jgi:glutaredoxin